MQFKEGINLPHRCNDGKLVFNFLIDGPPKSGVKTIFEYLFRNWRAGENYNQDIERIEESSRNILSFKINSTNRVHNVCFQINAIVRKEQENIDDINYLIDLEGIDGVVFVWDSLIQRYKENMCHLKEIIRLISLDSDYPLIIFANKRDLDNIVDISRIRHSIDTISASNVIIQETIACTGINVKRGFVYVARNCVLNHYKNMRTSEISPKNDSKYLKFIDDFSICPVCKTHNHHDYLEKFYYNKSPIKVEIKESLLELIEKLEKLDQFYNKVIVGIPCCDCFKKFSEEK